MAFRPPVECPICGETLVIDRTLEDHLRRAHTHDDVIRFVVARHEPADARPPS